jgi:hypothetical protein
VIYPDTIKVEKYTHMDRVEMDDLEPAAGAVGRPPVPRSHVQAQPLQPPSQQQQQPPPPQQQQQQQQGAGCQASQSLMHGHALPHYEHFPPVAQQAQAEGQQTEQAAAEDANVSPQVRGDSTVGGPWLHRCVD